MRKKDYMKPAMRVVKIQHTGIICASKVGSVSSGDTGIGYGGSDADYSGPVRARSFGGWDDEEE